MIGLQRVFGPNAILSLAQTLVIYKKSMVSSIIDRTIRINIKVVDDVLKENGYPSILFDSIIKERICRLCNTERNSQPKEELKHVSLPLVSVRLDSSINNKK